MGGQTTRFTWDDEDRLASTTLPEGHTDGNTYTGLGMRLSKTDGGVGYAYLCDGVSPASPVLSDGLLSFTPGISQTLGTPNGSGGMTYASHFYAEDAVGNLRGMSDAGVQGYPDAYNWDGFGQLIGRAGGTSTPFGYGEASGYQTDGDSGLRLLGHRYYDSRTGRFISQDPAGDGDNWYAYADNDPIDGVDPDGLSMQMPPTGETMAHDAMMGFLGGLSFGGSGMGGDGSYTKTDYHYQWQQTGTWQPNGTGGLHVVWQDDWSILGLTDVTSTTFDMGGSGMFANFHITPPQQPESLGHYLLRQFLSGGHADGSHFVPAGSVPTKRGAGPSGKAKIHYNRSDTKKKAFEKAKLAGAPGKDPIHEARPKVGDPHYHAVDSSGQKIEDGVHYSYPP